MTDPTDARHAKKDAMSQVEANANAVWNSVADDGLFVIAGRQEFLTSEDLRTYLTHTSPGTTTHEMRALGPVMLRGARNGLIEKHSFTLYQSKSRHLAPCQVWRSLIYNGPKAVAEAEG